MIRIQTRDINESFHALQELGDIGFKNDHSIARRLAKNLRGLKSLQAETQDERQAIIQTHAQVDAETGQRKMKKIGQTADGSAIEAVVWENDELAEKAMSDFQKEWHEIQGEPFTDEDLRSAKKPITGTLLAELGPYYPLDDAPAAPANPTPPAAE